MHKVVTLQGGHKGEEKRSMKHGPISITEYKKNAFISEKPASEILNEETNSDFLPNVMAPPPQGAGPSHVRTPKAARWMTYFALLVLGTLLVHHASAVSSITNSPSSVNLAWDASPGTNVTGYAVYYGSASRDYTSRVDVGNSLSFTVTGLAPNQTYYFTANAYDATGDESDFSNEIVVSTVDTNSGPPAPTNNIVIVGVPVLSSTNMNGPWQLEAMYTLTYTNPPGTKFFTQGQLTISNFSQ